MNSRKKMMNEPSSEKQRWSLRKLSVGMKCHRKVRHFRKS